MVAAKSASSQSEKALRRAFRFLSAEQVVAIHDALLEAWGVPKAGDIGARPSKASMLPFRP